MKTKHFLILVGVGVGVAWYAKNKAVEAAGDVAQAVNPINDNNIFHQGASAVVSKITGRDDTVGGHIYEWLNNE